MYQVKIKEAPNNKRHHNDGRDLPAHLLRLLEEGDKQVLSFAKWHFMTATAGSSRSLRAKLLVAQKLRQLRQEFAILSQQWKEDTLHFSLVKQKISHPSFLRIIGLGQDALPLIFAEFKRQPLQSWVIALEAITGEAVATEAVTYKEVVESWLAWGAEQGYI